MQTSVGEIIHTALISVVASRWSLFVLYAGLVYYVIFMVLCGFTLFKMNSMLKQVFA